MTPSSFVKAGIVTLITVIAFFIAWELHLRSKGIKISYDDGESLWADKRAMVYKPSDKATVFIGSSRNKFSLDIDTWEHITGERAVQLAMEGNSPLPILDDLANDKRFKGKVVIDVTEGLFFSTAPNNITEPAANAEYYKKETPAQRFSFLVNEQLESKLVFLNKNHFSLHALINEFPVKKRPGVFALPHDCPRDFNPVTFGRQNIMTDRFLTDTTLQKKVTDLWAFYRKMSKEPPANPAKRDSVIATIKKDADKIEGRGGKVIFLRTPSSGPFRTGEKMAFPREKYWEPLLMQTGRPGIHFEDYPAIAHFICPEFSHLKHADAIVFTKTLITILEEKGWAFPYKQNAL